MTNRNLDGEEMIEISVSEIKTIRQLSDALKKQNDLYIQEQRQTNELLKSLLEQLGRQETLVIPAPEVTVKAAEVVMPPMPAPVVQVMEAPEAPDKLKVYKLIRKNGLLVQIEEAYK